MANGEGFISGIHNYCDRWCEHCRLWERCRVGIAERGAGSRASEPEDDFEQIARHLQDAVDLLTRECERLGIDPDAAVEADLPDTSDHPLRVRAFEWCKRTRCWLDTCEQAAPVAPPPPGDAQAECRAVVGWYHTLVPVKVARALSSRAHDEAERQQGRAPSVAADADGSAKVAWLALLRVVDSLTRSYEAWGDQTGTLEVLLGAQRLVEEIDREFPGHRSFRRPGLDGPE